MIQKIKYALLILLTIPLFAQPKALPMDTTTIHSRPLCQKDTVVIVHQIIDNKIIKDYEQILEKTNSQLSLWWNPYGLFVAILGILFAILAIIAAFVIYRQSREYKELINKSLEEHKAALDKLITEKNNQLENDKMRLDSLIMEYKEKLKTAGDENKKELKEFISKLEEQKEFIDTRIHTYKHSGYEPKDILENYPINQNTIFNTRITLNYPNQPFVIYFRVIAANNKKFWLGFAGGTESKPFKSNDEYTPQQIYSSKEVVINENIVSFFKQGFPTLDTNPVQIDCIRLRASNDLKEITFSYKII